MLALFKGHDRYIYLYDDASRAQLIDHFRDQAADPAVNFNWFDAAVLTEKAREQGLVDAGERQPPPSRIGEFSSDEGLDRQ